MYTYVKNKKLFQEEKEQNILNEDDKDIISEKEIISDELNIEKRDNIKINGISIKIKNEENEDKKE